MIRKKQIFLGLSVLLAVGLSLTACGSDNVVQSTVKPTGSIQGKISGSGSSAQKAAMDVWRSNFTQYNPDTTVEYSPDGSGAGRTALLSGGVQFAGSDAALKDKEISKSTEQCGAGGAIDIPAYISPIAIIFNLEGVNDLRLDAKTISKIFRGEITHWQDSAIVQQNPTADLPDLAITPVHRNDKSGTTQNFTEYLEENVPDVWTDESSQHWPTSLEGESAKGTSGIITTVTDTRGTISYADEGEVPRKLGRAQIKVKDTYVKVSQKGAAKTVELSPLKKNRPKNDVAVDIDRTPASSEAYPLILVSYHIVCTQYSDKNTTQLVKDFENYVISDQGQKDASEVAQNAPLPKALAKKAQKSIDSITAK